MKTFSEFQEEMNKKVPPVIGLGGGGGGTDSITAKSSAKSFKKRVGDVAKVLTFPFHKRRKDPTEKFATEGVASLAVKGGSKLIPALVTGIGAAGTIMQSKKKDKDVNITPRGLKNLENAVFRDKKGRKLDAEILKRREQKKAMKGPFADTPSAEELRKAKLTGQLIKPKETEITKQKELVSKAEKEITKPKKGEKKKAKKVIDTFKKVRKIEGKTMMRIKQDAEISKKGPGAQVPEAKSDYLKNLLKNLRIKNLRKEEVAIANSMSGGGIAGSVEAGHEPPVNKRKKKGEPTIMARGLLPGARTRFKTGADFLTNLKKNKYT